MAQNNWTKPTVNEALCALYLRLNGYFTTGLIVHSPEWGNNYTEIDCLAVRHPNHIQPDRQIGPAPFLAIFDDRVDLLICETKSVPTEVAFNKRLWSEPVVLERVLQWAGILPNGDIPRVTEQLRPLLHEGLNARNAKHGVLAAEIRVRGLLCCPPATEEEIPTGWCLIGSEILRYANECFNPTIRRDTCSTRYDFKLWGSFLAPIVDFLKNQQPGTVPPLEDLYEHLGAA
jgi:hypothetical protein